MEKCKQMTTKNNIPRKNNVEVTVAEPTKLEIFVNKSIQVAITSISMPVISQPIEYSSLKCLLLTSSKT
jgi:hypothetical protein